MPTHQQIAESTAQISEQPPAFYLELSAAPRANVRLYLTLPPQGARTYTVEKWATRFGHTWERHIQPNGVATWYRLIAPGYIFSTKQNAWRKT